MGKYEFAESIVLVDGLISIVEVSGRAKVTMVKPLTVPPLTVITSCADAPYLSSRISSLLQMFDFQPPLHCEASCDHLSTRNQNVVRIDLSFSVDDLLRQLVNPKDRANANTCIQIRRAVNWVTGDNISSMRLLEDDGLFLLFRDHHSALPRALHRRNEDVIPDHIELFLVIAGGVGRSCEPCKVDQSGTANVIGYGLEGKLESMAEKTTSNRWLA